MNALMTPEDKKLWMELVAEEKANLEKLVITVLEQLGQCRRDIDYLRRQIMVVD